MESYFQVHRHCIAALLDAPELYRCTQLVKEVMYEVKAHQVPSIGHEAMCLEGKSYIHHQIFLSEFLEVLHIPSVQKSLFLLSLNQEVQLPVAISALADEMYQGHLWFCVPSITPISLYKTSCTPVITLFSWWPFWKLFLTHTNLLKMSGNCLGKLYLT